MKTLPLHIAYIGIGSNIGDRQANCEHAVSLVNLQAAMTVTKQASWIETDPVGYTDQAKFINGAIEIKTSLSPQDLLRALKSIEAEMGREKTIKWGPRIIDLDILLYDDLILKSKALTIPHPEISNREFVKIPLREIKKQTRV